MLQNIKDWRTTLSGLILIAATVGLPIAKAKWPQYSDAFTQAATVLGVGGGAHLLLGARSGGPQ